MLSFFQKHRPLKKGCNMTTRQENLEMELLSSFSDKEKWESWQQKNPSVIFDMASIFLHQNNTKGMKELFERTINDRKPSLLSHILIQSNRARNEDAPSPFMTVPLQKKFLKAPYSCLYQKDDIENFCRMAPKAINLSFSKVFLFLDTVAPSWKEDNVNLNFKYTTTFFCNANLRRSDNFVRENPNFLKEVEAFVSFVNRNSEVLTKDMMPSFFALKEKTEILKELDLSQKPSQKSKMI